MKDWPGRAQATNEELGPTKAALSDLERESPSLHKSRDFWLAATVEQVNRLYTLWTELRLNVSVEGGLKMVRRRYPRMGLAALRQIV